MSWHGAHAVIFRRLRVHELGPVFVTVGHSTIATLRRRRFVLRALAAIFSTADWPPCCLCWLVFRRPRFLPRRLHLLPCRFGLSFSCRGRGLAVVTSARACARAIRNSNSGLRRDGAVAVPANSDAISSATRLRAASAATSARASASSIKRRCLASNSSISEVAAASFRLAERSALSSCTMA